MNSPEITDAEIVDFPAEMGEEAQESANAPYHSILEIWRASLKPVLDEAREISLVEAANLCASYPQLTFPQAALSYSMTQAGMIDALGVLERAIEANEHCLEVNSPAEDAEENKAVYEDLIFEFHRVLRRVERSFDATASDAPALSATFHALHHMLFSGDAGLLRFLDNINFVFTAEAQQDLAAALEEDEKQAALEKIASTPEKGA